MPILLDCLRGRCPVCRQGAIFASFFRMYPDCPHCQVHFEREQGFFSMSIFIGEVLAAVLAVPFLALGWLLDLPLTGLVALPGLAILAFIPVIFRFGRILWLYIDHWLDPRNPPAPDRHARG